MFVAWHDAHRVVQLVHLALFLTPATPRGRTPFYQLSDRLIQELNHRLLVGQVILHQLKDNRYMVLSNCRTDYDQIWHAYVNRSGNGSNLKKISPCMARNGRLVWPLSEAGA